MSNIKPGDLVKVDGRAQQHAHKVGFLRAYNGFKSRLAVISTESAPNVLIPVAPEDLILLQAA